MRVIMCLLCIHLFCLTGYATEIIENKNKADDIVFVSEHLANKSYCQSTISFVPAKYIELETGVFKNIFPIISKYESVTENFDFYTTTYNIVAYKVGEYVKGSKHIDCLRYIKSLD